MPRNVREISTGAADGRLQICRLDPDLRFVEPGTAALGASPWLGEPIGPEYEPTLFASRGLDDHAVSRCLSGPHGVAEIRFDVSPVESHLTRERRHRTRLRRQRLHQIAAKDHVRF
jgi:hypothetical protein